MWRWALILIAAAVGVSALAHQRRELEESWDRQVQSALDQAQLVRERAEDAYMAAAVLEAERDSLRAVLDEQGRRNRRRAEQLRAAPEDSFPAASPHVELIDSLELEVDGWRGVTQLQDSVIIYLRTAYREVSADHADLVELMQSRPGPRSVWIPRAGVGLFTGVSIDGRPAVGVGLTLTWEIF